MLALALTVPAFAFAETDEERIAALEERVTKLDALDDSLAGNTLAAQEEARKKQQIAEIKEIQLSCHIDVNDFNTKVNHALRFLGNGDKVRVMVKFRGRQITHSELGVELLKKFEQACAEKGTVEKAPAIEGRSMIMFISPLKPTASKEKAKAASDAGK